MTRMFVAAIAALVVALNAIPAGAQFGEPKIAVHIQPHNAAKGAVFCDDSPVGDGAGSVGAPTLSCTGYTTSAAVGTPTDLYVIIAQADTNGVSGATFGIQYNNSTGAGIDFVGSWRLCSSGLEFPSVGWPASGEGNVLTWNTVTDCGLTKIDPDGIHATAGGMYVYAYDPDSFVITQHLKLTSGPALLTANCLGAEISLGTQSAGFVSFGGSGGCNPCLAPCSTPVEATTWGRIKDKY